MMFPPLCVGRLYCSSSIELVVGLFKCTLFWTTYASKVLYGEIACSEHYVICLVNMSRSSLVLSSGGRRFQRAEDCDRKSEYARQSLKNFLSYVGPPTPSLSVRMSNLTWVSEKVLNYFLVFFPAVLAILNYLN